MITDRDRQITVQGIIEKLAAALLVAVIILTATVANHVSYADDVPETDASSAIVMSGSTGEIIYAKHAERKYPTAVSGKLVAAMVILDRMKGKEDLQRKVRISSEAADKGDMFEKGEQLTSEDLLHAMLMADSDEAATALALTYCGSVLSCIEEMNSRVQQMRLSGTRYTNLSGAYDVNQYSTAKDVAMITAAAFRYGEIGKIVNCKSYDLKSGERHGARTIDNANPLMSGSGAYAGMFGGMQGFLDAPYPAATYTGAAYADDMGIIVVLLDGNRDSIVRDVTSLMNYGYRHVTKKLFIEKGTRVGFAKVRGGIRTIVPVYTARKGYIYIPREGSEELVTHRAEMNPGLKAPLKAGDKVGDYKIYVAGELKGSVDLIVKDDIGKGWPPSYIYISNIGVLMLSAVLTLILVLWLMERSKRKKKRRIKLRKRQEEIMRRALEEKAIEDDRTRRNWTYGNFTPREGDTGLEPAWRRAEVEMPVSAVVKSKSDSDVRPRKKRRKTKKKRRK